MAGEESEEGLKIGNGPLLHLWDGGMGEWMCMYTRVVFVCMSTA